MPKTFKIGEHMRWNSEAGGVRVIIIKKITSDVKFKGYVHHASREAGEEDTIQRAIARFGGREEVSTLAGSKV